MLTKNLNLMNATKILVHFKVAEIEMARRRKTLETDSFSSKQ
jgi:hypothetical protein